MPLYARIATCYTLSIVSVPLRIGRCHAIANKLAHAMMMIYHALRGHQRRVTSDMDISTAGVLALCDGAMPPRSTLARSLW